MNAVWQIPAFHANQPSVAPHPAPRVRHPLSVGVSNVPDKGCPLQPLHRILWDESLSPEQHTAPCNGLGLQWSWS